MARSPGFDKRRKELARQEHQREKAAKKAQRKADRENRPADAGAEDPDLAGIVAGPQPTAAELLDLPGDAEEERDEESAGT